MAKERILITVKTYPTLSSTYGELVCTAGLREDGSWVRIYPVPFRRLEQYQKFEKYRVIEAELIRNRKDSRPESHKIDIDSLEFSEEKLGTRDCWRQRREWVLGRGEVYHDLSQLITAANECNELSLAIFKPAAVIAFKAEAQEPNWDPEKLDKLQAESRQGDLFDEWKPKQLTRLVKKLPWKFSYVLADVEGRESTMMIEDWEIGALYWNCVRAGKSPEQAVADVRKMYFDTMTERDLHLYLGTTRQWHGKGKNPFVVIGTFHPPHQNQAELLF